METRPNLGEFEQLVLLAILRLGDAAYGLNTREELANRTGREVTRGAWYTTLDRLGKKGFVTWSLEEGGEDRSGLPMRRYTVTGDGLDALRRSRRVLMSMWRGVEGVLEESRT